MGISPEIPDGYIPGQNRTHKDDPKVTHLYKGDFNDPGLPMCVRGWNRDNGESYSIWRNNISSGGICKICLRRAQKGLEGVPSKYRVANDDK
jgi:hypothetical protein